jgi:hypothetical protein
MSISICSKEKDIIALYLCQRFFAVKYSLFASIYTNSKSKRYLCWQRSPAHAWGVVCFLNVFAGNGLGRHLPL